MQYSQRKRKRGFRIYYACVIALFVLFLVETVGRIALFRRGQARGDAGDTDAACLDGQNLIDLGACKKTRPFGSHVVEQLDIALMVQKCIDLEDVSLFNDAVAANTILKLLHKLDAPMYTMFDASIG